MALEMDSLQTQIQAEPPFCRLCFSTACELYELFPNAGNENESLLIKILEVVPIAISFEEDINSYICGKCVTLVEEFYEYREKVKENDALLREKRKSVDHATIYNVVSMQPDATHSSSPNGGTNGGSELGGAGGGAGGGGLDESQVGLEQRISLEGGPPLNGNILEFKKQLFTASPTQMGVWLCVASASDIQCPAAIEVDDNIQVVAEIGQHNHGLPVSVAENPMDNPKHSQQQQQQQQQQHQQQQASVEAGTCVVVNTGGSPDGLLSPCPAPVTTSSVGSTPNTSTGKSSSSKKKKSRDQPSKRKVSNDILVGDGWLIDTTNYKRNHYQLVTKDGYQTFLIYNGYRFRTQQKIRNGIAAWKCAWNGRKGCQAILHITEDYQKVKEVGSPHNHDPSLRDRIISNKPSNGSGSDQSMIMQSDGEEMSELHKITTTSGGAVLAHPGSSSTTLAGETVALTGGGGTITITGSTSTTTTASHGITNNASLDLSSDMDFVQQNSSSGSELITTPGSSGSADHQTTAQHHHHQPQHQHGHHQHHSHHGHHHHHEVVGGGGMDEVVKEESTMSMDIEEIIRPHVVPHPVNE